MPLQGKFVEREKSFDIHDKYSSEIIDSLPLMESGDVELAVNAALHGLKDMDALTGFDRQQVLIRTANSILARKERLTEELIAETGMIRRQAEFEIERASNILRLYAGEVLHLQGEAPTLDADARGKTHHGYSFRVPVGVVAAISAFNNPLVLLSHKLGPSIAAGNSVVFKPASLTPLAAVEVCHLLIESGLPSNAINVLTGNGETLGPALAGNPHVRVVTFTGGREAGEQITRVAGVKRLLMELGSNCPNIVTSGADLDLALAKIVSAAYSYQGQNCLHAQRILVQDMVYEEFKQRFTDLASKLKMGDPKSASTDIGPMISEAAAKRVEEWVNEALQVGAKLLLGGRRSAAFYEPTLLEDVPPETRVVSKEIFGPVSVLIRFSDITEAIDIANSTEYGLQAAIFTPSIDEALHALKNLQFGTVMINECTDFRVDMMPFGGFKGSGLGREGVGHSIEAMTEIKMAVYNLGA
ncbi:MAG: aldehyde dehydrogenase family protein [Candidatus Bathyarchaeia archaeon]